MTTTRGLIMPAATLPLTIAARIIKHTTPAALLVLTAAAVLLQLSTLLLLLLPLLPSTRWLLAAVLAGPLALGAVALAAVACC